MPVDAWVKLAFAAFVVVAVGFTAYCIARDSTPDGEPVGGQLVEQGDVKLQTPQAEERARAAAIRESDRRVREALGSITSATTLNEAGLWRIVGHLDDAELFVLHERYKKFRDIYASTLPPGQRAAPDSFGDWVARNRGQRG